ncbi:MAG TPA: ergothioneine biosynthesis protein EgtB [Gammaproteobacteria bacterium]|nr:ergothioneine biosynthesis protein EgtB [Gammaproteobacteria bacterium]
MSTSLSTLIRLRAIQNKTHQLFEGMKDTHYRLQFHHDLSPAGWYLGHAMFVENYWLHDIIDNNNQYTLDTHLFVPGNCPLAQRGPCLPPLEEQLSSIRKQQDNNAIRLLEKTPPLSNHTLFKDEYIENFIIQQYAQDYESIQQVLNQIALRADKGHHIPARILLPQKCIKNTRVFEQGNYAVGGQLPNTYDNELPEHSVFLARFSISASPVSNAEYLCFIEDDGYATRQWWSEQGWQWTLENSICQPEHWKQNHENQWYGVSPMGAHDLAGDEVVCGLSHFEAAAFARWAGARLPHEHEWEVAARSGQLVNTTKAWEWCQNIFYPYDNFEAYPYVENLLQLRETGLSGHDLSDGHHSVLKGASPYTRPEIKRASFRNAAPAHHRHIFAGLRLVFEQVV